ncbi:MAG: hypothetical protein M3167_06915 [Acidobacteriota bacterium]|nr:hypothetical protein [Acidobacteriota bacterium]
MTKRINRVLGSAVLVGGFAFAGASNANAQVSFRGSFPLPHGRISISAGEPFYQAGSYAPDDCDIYQSPDYGYGFVSNSRFVPVREYDGRWVVTSAPARFSTRYDDWRSARVYRRADERNRYERRDGRRDDRRDVRNDRRDWRDDRRDDRRDNRNDRWQNDRYRRD